MKSKVKSDSGATITSGGENQWKYFEIGKVNSVTPAQGQIDTVVTIMGARLLGGGKSVRSLILGGVELNSTIKEATNDRIVLVSKNGGENEHDLRIVSDTGAFITTTNVWSYLKAGSISSVQPDYGQFKTRVTIKGDRLMGGRASISNILLAGISVAVCYIIILL